MPIRMLALDLDGTVLDGHGGLTESACEAVATVRSRGIRVVLCTGRRFRTALPVARELRLSGTIVVNNGVLIKDIESGTTLENEFLPADVYGEVLSLMRELVPPLVYVDEYHESTDMLTERIEDVSISQRLVDSPACVVAAADDMSPQIRRMLEASGQELPETKPVLEINAEHPLLQRLAAEADSKRFTALSEIVLDHALLADGSQLENPADYVQRMNKLLLELDSNAGTS